MCQLEHWNAHKVDCRRWSAELATALERVFENRDDSLCPSLSIDDACIMIIGYYFKGQ
jgi:hypothetical protein